MLDQAVSNDGFTIVELLVVMAVMGIVMIPVAVSFTQSQKAIRASKSRQTASELAQKCLGLLRSTVDYKALPTGGGSISCDGKKTGGEPYSFDIPYEKYDYVTKVNRVKNSGGELALKKIRIRVLYPSAFHDGNRCITTVDCGSSDWDFQILVARR